MTKIGSRYPRGYYGSTREKTIPEPAPSLNHSYSFPRSNEKEKKSPQKKRKAKNLDVLEIVRLLSLFFASWGAIHIWYPLFLPQRDADIVSKR